MSDSLGEAAMKRKAQSSAVFRPPQQTVVTVRCQQSVERAALGETSEPAPTGSDQIADMVNNRFGAAPPLNEAVEQPECATLQHPGSDQTDPLGILHAVEPDRMISTKLPSTELAMESGSVITEEPDSDITCKHQNDSDLDLKPTTGTKLEKVAPKKTHEAQRPFSPTGSLDVNLDKLLGGTAEPVDKTLSFYNDKEILKSPPRKRLRRRMGMCGLGDKRKSFPCGGPNFRQVPTGGQNEEENIEPLKRTLVEDSGTTQKDTEGGSGPACAGISKQLKGNCSEGNIGTALMYGKDASGPACRENGEGLKSFGTSVIDSEAAVEPEFQRNQRRLKSNTFEEHIGTSKFDLERATGPESKDNDETLRENALEKNVGTALMDDEGATGKPCKGHEESLRSNSLEENTGTLEFDEKGATRPESRDNEEKLGSNTLEDSIGSLVMEDKRATGPACRENREELRSNSLEEKAGTTLMADETTRPVCRGNIEALRSISLEENIGTTLMDEEDGTGPDCKENREGLRSISLEENIGTTLMDEEDGTGPDCKENREGLRSNSLEENIGTTLMDEEDGTGPDCKENREGLRSISLEEKAGTTLMADETTGPVCRENIKGLRHISLDENIGTTLMDEEDGTGPDCKENREGLRSNSLEENVGTTLMDDETTEPACKVNEEKLRSNSLEENTGTTLLDDEGATGPSYKGNGNDLRNNTTEVRDGATIGGPQEHRDAPKSNTLVDYDGVVLMEIDEGVETAWKRKTVENDSMKENDGITETGDGGTTGPTCIVNLGTLKISASENNDALVDHRGKSCKENVSKVILEIENKSSALTCDGGTGGSPCKGNREELRDPMAEEENGPALINDKGTTEGFGEHYNDPLERNNNSTLVDFGGFAAQACEENKDVTKRVYLDEGNDESALMEDEVILEPSKTEQAPLGPLISNEHEMEASDGDSNESVTEMNSSVHDIETNMDHAEELNADSAVADTNKVPEASQVAQEVPGLEESEMEFEDLPSCVTQKFSSSPDAAATNAHHPFGSELSDLSTPAENGPGPFIAALVETEQTASLEVDPVLPAIHDVTAADGKERDGDVNIPTAPPTGLKSHTHDTCGPLVTPAVAEQQFSYLTVTPAADETDACVPLSLHSVTDSQLHKIALSMDLDDRPIPEVSDQYEDATELVCGLIRELSSLNRTVMAAHREIELLRRSSRLPNPPIRRNCVLWHSEI